MVRAKTPRALSPAAAGAPAAIRWPSPHWLDLFYDLAFAAGIIALSSSYAYDYSLGGALWFATAYGILGCAWVLTGAALGSFGATERRATTTPVVLLLALQMTAIVMLAVISADTLAATADSFDIALGLLLVTCLALSAHGRRAEVRVPTLTMALMGVAIGCLIGAFVLPDLMGLIAWFAALLALVGAAWAVLSRMTIDVRRLAHRLAELTLIILGEILVKIVLTVGDETVAAVRIEAIAPVLLILVGLWWVYFTGTMEPPAVRLTGRLREVWVAAHLLLHVGLLALAVGLGKLVVRAETFDKVSGMLAVLTSPAVLVVGALAVIEWATGGPRLRAMVVAAVGLGVWAGLAAVVPLGPSVTGYGLAALLLLLAWVTSRPRSLR